jgi:parallel beta-helix repeat protein
MVTSVARFGVFFVSMVGVAFLPGAASAQTLSVAPTSVSAQSYTGQDAPSQTLIVRNAGGKALKWVVGAPTEGWLSISPARGTQAGSIILTFRTAGLSAGSYQTSFGVDSNGGSATVNVQLSVETATAPVAAVVPKLVVSCPSNVSIASQDGGPVVVNYSATTSGGVAPTSVTGNPASGSAFPVGTTPVAVTAQSSDGQSASCSFTVTVTYTAPSPSPSPSAVGPQSTITCPAGAVAILPGQFIQSFVNIYPGGTTFCLGTGVHNLTSSITPKTGDVFVGQYGAILDGSGWSTTDPSQAAFRAHNEDIDDVTIRNLVIRNMPQRGIHAYYWASDRWTIEYNEIASNQHGVAAPNNSLVRNNYIHHNAAGGYSAFRSANTVFDGNDISYNGKQKVLAASNITFRNNFIHDNLEDGIWYDGDSVGGVVEGNTSEGNNGEGIFIEISSQIIVRNNTLRRNVSSGIFISTSKNIEAYNNTLEDNWRGIQYYLNCDAVGGGNTGYDLTNNSVHDNVIKIGTLSGSFGDALSYVSTCSATQVAPYLNGQKNLRFVANRYFVPSTTTRYFVWGINTFKSWSEWQALGNDTTGTYQLR